MDGAAAAPTAQPAPPIGIVLEVKEDIHSPPGGPLRLGAAILLPRPRANDKDSYSVVTDDDGGVEVMDMTMADLSMSSVPLQMLPVASASALTPMIEMSPPPSVMVQFEQSLDHSDFHIEDLSKLFKDSISGATHSPFTVDIEFNIIRNCIFPFTQRFLCFMFFPLEASVVGSLCGLSPWTQPHRIIAGGRARPTLWTRRRVDRWPPSHASRLG